MSLKRKQVLLAVLGSILLHCLVLLLWAVAVEWIPATHADAPPPPEPIRLEIVQATPPPVPAAPEAEATPTPTPLFDTANMPEASQPPADKQFDSDKNTAAASELPANGDQPWPTQRGRKIPAFMFDTHEYVPGDQPAIAQSGVPATPPPPAPDTAPPLPKPVATPSHPPPTPAPAPEAAPTPMPDIFAKLESTPTPPPTLDEPNPYDPSFRPPSTMTEPPLPTPVPRTASRQAAGSQNMEQKTEVSGNINNRGAASVAAGSSPQGRYMKAVTDAIRHRWNAYISNRLDLASIGAVKIHLTIDREGRVRTPQVLTNTANEALASVSLQAIMDASIPPIPSDAAATMDGGQLQIDLTFELLE